MLTHDRRKRDINVRRRLLGISRMTLRRPLPLLQCLSILSLAFTLPLRAEHPSLPQAVEQAHSELWHRFVDPHGIICDFVGELPTPEDCNLGKPNAIGWWSPIEDGPMFTGLYLPAACERARRTGHASDRTNARRLMHGLIKCTSVSDVPGFIARGIGTNGMCHYPLGSDDQTHPWFLGLRAYFTSGFAADDERRQIVAKVQEVAEVLESTGWRCPCDGAFKGQFRGGFQGHLFRDAVRYLHMLRITHDITGDPVWLDRYRKALAEKPAQGDKTRADICADGFPHDREAIKNIDGHGLWIYVGSQAALAGLIRMEPDESLRAKYRAGLAINAKNARVPMEAHAQFDNHNKEVFGNADWRKGYPKWFPQLTQADAQKLSEMGDKTVLGKRKYYETRYMRNPLAAAAIVALAGNEADRAAVEQVIRHYDYSKLNLSVLFFAECAWYALPCKP